MEINEAFSSDSILNQVTEIEKKLNTFDVTADAEKKEISKGMNLTTQDRPIDNIRNITPTLRLFSYRCIFCSRRFVSM